jgi:thymidylate kinase
VSGYLLRLLRLPDDPRARRAQAEALDAVLRPSRDEEDEMLRAAQQEVEQRYQELAAAEDFSALEASRLLDQEYAELLAGQLDPLG